MKRLVIQNEIELLAIKDILENYPSLLPKGINLSAITNKTRKDIISKIDKIMVDDVIVTLRR